MSSDYDRHIILHHLDDPIRILYWTVDEALSLMIPIFVGIAVGHPLIGVGFAFLLFWSLRKIKKTYGLESLVHIFYWNFPTINKNLKNTPKSYIREYIG